LLRRGLGDENVEALFRAYEGRVPAEADLVCYWFLKAWEALQAGRAKRVGLVATNSIRGGANRKVLEPIAERNAIFEAWSDEPWTVEGAAVRVSLVCFDNSLVAQERKTIDARLNGASIARIGADLTTATSNLTKALNLAENAHVASNGVSKKGKFEIAGEIARAWIQDEFNPNGKSNALVLAPWRNGDHFMRDPHARAVQFSCKLGILSTKLRSRAARHRVLRTFRPPSALIKL